MDYENALTIGFNFITGMCLGIELVTGEEVGQPAMEWGLSIDLLIFRITVSKYPSLPDGFV